MLGLATSSKFLIVRVLSCSNRLPSVVMDAQSLEVFKVRLSNLVGGWWNYDL